MKNKTKGIIGGVVAVLIVALGVGALATASKGFTDWDTNNWQNNFEDLFNKDDPTDVPTDEKLETLDVDQLDDTKTYLMPSKSVNFGNSRMSDDKEATSDILSYQGVGNKNATMANKGVMPLAASSPITYPQTVQLSATVTPVESEAYCEFQWEVSWSGEEDIADYIVLENSTTKTVTVKVLQPFTHSATLKVTATANDILPVSDTCNIEFYKQLTGIDLTMTGGMTDKILSEGEMITYEVHEQYSTGTIDQVDETDAVITYESLISDYEINYDFKKNESTAFSHNEFYNATGNFENVNVLTGAGRNAMNAKLKSSSGDFKITASKGGFSKSINLDVDPETVVYPESVQIGDGSDIEIGKN